MQYLYLIESGSVYKIGISSDPLGRLAQLQTANPANLKMVLCYEFENALVIEKALHQTFIDTHIGGEWFSLDLNQIIKIKKLCEMMRGREIEFPLSDPKPYNFYMDEALKPSIISILICALLIALSI